MSYKINIKNFNVNSEVGGKTVFLNSFTLRTPVASLEIAIPDPWSSFSVASFNELTGI
jgi:hypothetical protein